MLSDAPVVSIKLGSSLKANDINEGDDVYFECDIQANPKFYKLLWFKDGKELHQNSTAGIILPRQSLVLQSVTRSSAGEYSCMAVNVEGKSESRPITLEVMCEYIPFYNRSSESIRVTDTGNSTEVFLIHHIPSSPDITISLF